MKDPATESVQHIDAVTAPRDMSTPVPPRRALSRIWFTALLAFLIIAGLAFHILKPAPPQPAVADAPDTARPVPVEVATAITGDFGITIEALGTVTPLATVSVTSEVSGKLVKIFYEEGQMVKAGDPLAEIDPRPFENTLHQAQGQLLRDQALLDNAKLDLERYRLLVKQNSAPRQQLDTQESLVHQDEGTVKIDQAMVDSAELNLDYCTIKAPVTGRVGLRLVDLGNYVSAGSSNGVVVITQLQPVTVIFPVAEDHLPGVMKQVLAGKKLPAEAYDRGDCFAHGLIKSPARSSPQTDSERLQRVADGVWTCPRLVENHCLSLCIVFEHYGAFVAEGRMPADRIIKAVDISGDRMFSLAA